MNDPNSIKSQKPISSEEIRKNFRGEKKERYLGLKLLVGFGIVVVFSLIYRFVRIPSGVGKTASAPALVQKKETVSNAGDTNSKIPAAVPNAVDKNSRTTISSPSVSVPIQAPAKPQQLYLSVSGNSLTTLRQKLKTASEKIMSQGNVKPVNASLNINTFSFRCDLVEVDPMERVKLVSLLWGPLAVGCESCINALSQNPGSEVLIRKTDNAFEYNVLAIR